MVDRYIDDRKLYIINIYKYIILYFKVIYYILYHNFGIPVKDQKVRKLIDIPKIIILDRLKLAFHEAKHILEVF